MNQQQFLLLDRLNICLCIVFRLLFVVFFLLFVFVLVQLFYEECLLLVVLCSMIFFLLSHHLLQMYYLPKICIGFCLLNDYNLNCHFCNLYNLRNIDYYCFYYEVSIFTPITFVN